MKKIFFFLSLIIFPVSLKAQSDWNKMAEGMSQALITHFWGASFPGYPNRYYFNYGSDLSDMVTYHYWPQAHAMDVMVDAYLRTSDPRYLDIYPLWWVGAPRFNSGKPQDPWWNPYVDDMEWIVLAQLRMFESSHEEKYFTKAKQLYNDYIWPTWGPENEAPWFGGITWKVDVSKSKNACSNGPAAIIAARIFSLYNLATDHDSKSRQTYQEEAVKIYNWLRKTLFDPAEGKVYDNINSKGGVSRAVYTYNQGTFIGAAHELYKITGNKDYLADAVLASNYVVDHLSDNNGVLRNSAGGDGGLFNGIFFRYFVKLINEPALDGASREKFHQYITRCATVLAENGLNTKTMLYGGDWWKAPGDTAKVGLTPMLSGCMLMEAMCVLKPLTPESGILSVAQTPAVVPSNTELNRQFGKQDTELFKNPPKVYHPETWFHFIGGNVSKAGITADLEAIAKAGISGIQLFHGQTGGPWPGVEPQIACLSPMWDDAVKHAAGECRRLGLRFTMQNCPGWAMSGGPWIEPSNAMRNLVWSRTDVGSGEVNQVLQTPQPSKEDWRDYKDIAVLAFPSPRGDDGGILKPLSVKSDTSLPWKEFLSGEAKDNFKLTPASPKNPHWLEVIFSKPVVIRTIEFSDVQGFNHAWNFAPGVQVKVTAILTGGEIREILNTPMPMAAWQSDDPISLACDETEGVTTYRIEIINQHDMNLRSLRLLSAARKNNWESEAAWTLRSIVRQSEHPKQSAEAFIRSEDVLDISSYMNKDGKLKWKAPAGNWTILRIGHINVGRKNGPAPAEGTGWECDKLSEEGPKAHFAGYIGRLNKGPLSGGLLNGMLMDSWECYTQTWTNKMESEFGNLTGYPLRKMLPAVMGYVIDNQETTSRFLRDWRYVIGDLLVNRFYRSMAGLAKENGLNIVYETSAGDVFPADIMEYYKYADVPMCEFWHPYSDSYVGALNFKPIKPTASAARLYGKPRISAEAFTSFNLTWDEHLSMLKEVANLNFIEGVTHLVFHTYTHNPRTDALPPGPSFGEAGIGTPFLRGQTWWKNMPEFTTYLARLNYLFERGKPVSDVLWYLGDEINHKPDQEAPFPKGYKYDYCNPDVLLNRLSVRDGKIVTPEGLSYRVIWLPDNERMLPETLEKLLELVQQGATVIGNPPQQIATLIGGPDAQQRFDRAVNQIWGKNKEKIRTIEKGKVVAGITIDEALSQLNLAPDVIGDNALWLHRRVDGADWYYVSAPFGTGFQGNLSFRSSGIPEIWDPVTGAIEAASVVKQEGGRVIVNFDLPRSGSCFVVFREKGTMSIQAEASQNPVETIGFGSPWALSFPSGSGAPSSILLNELKAWKDLDMTQEAKSFSGTATYTATFDAGEVKNNHRFILDLGRVEMIASVSLNGKPIRTLWTPPYKLDLSEAVKPGINKLTVEVTSTWFNRMVFDAGQPENQRKTWTFKGPSKDEALRESGLLGPVTLTVQKP
jgi:predicted alpha-1,6-mannanase (GH76 family)